MTARELARKARISITALSMIENGKAPWKKAIRKVAAVLGVEDVVIQPKGNGGRRVA